MESSNVIDMTKTKQYMKEKDPELTKDLRSIDLEEQKAFLLSKKKAKDVNEIPAIGLCDPVAAKENDQETVILASYIRSGNSLTRGIVERLTGLYTGSDGALGIKLVRDLEDMGFLGEGIYDKRCWIIKTHYPESGQEMKFLAEKALVVVRNPLDSIPSAFNLTLTTTHDRSIHPDDFVTF